MTSEKATCRQVGNVSVLDMDGNIRIGDSSVALREAVSGLLAEGRNQILLNLSRVGYIDSLGLGELISIHITLKKNGGQIKLLHLTRRLRELMTITKLLTVFDVYEDEAEALDSFRASDLEITQPQPFLVAIH
ncbi:MAG: STAS domain-containing protein [bacterium]